ncbi:MAG TPA: DNA recombination protein RmuC [Patescibacteria group bacterium]|nr:DNA recombination protein RmuC [Patescibacteria group bacterium]
MSQTSIIVLIFAVLAANAILLFLLLRRKNNVSDSGSLNMLLTQLNEFGRTVEDKMNTLHRTFDSKLGESTKNVNESLRTQFSESAKLIRDVTAGLTKLDETNRQVVSFADQLQSLQDILKNPKQRGILGEYYLETLLKNVLPPGSYQMQYPFKDGTIVDAVVFVKEKIIPIDSKFSLENYNRLVEEKDPVERERLERAFKNDLKGRIDETAKYVQPAQGTMDFAFMFIPHEAIYYDLLVAQVGGIKINTRDLIEYAFKDRHVLIVSPTSFLAFLQTVLQGLKALQIEETAKDIIKRVEDLGKHLKSFEEYHGKLGSSLGTVVSHYNSSSREFKKLDKDVLRITGEAPGVETLVLEKPDREEE